MKYSNLKKLTQSKVSFDLSFKNNIYHFHFKNSKDLASTFIRFQEFYESPLFKGKKINLWNFYNYYKKFKKTEKFTYLNDWLGFNLPKDVFVDFQGFLNYREKILIESLDFNKKFYVIGTCGSKKTKLYKEIFVHEKAHAYFNLDQKYKKQVSQLIKTKHFPELIKYLKDLGYHSSVLVDEIQAYMIENFNDLLKENLVNSKHVKIYDKLIKIYKEKERA